MKAVLVAIGFVVFGSVGVVRAQSQGKPDVLEGVWRVSEIWTPASTNKTPQPGIFIFTKKHYSAVFVVGDKPRPEFTTDAAGADANELRAVFGAAFNAQSGTYEVKQGALFLHPLVAKNPSFMKPQSTASYYIKTDGSAVVLTDASGNIAYRLAKAE